MEALYSAFDSIGESLHIFYCLALLLAVYKYREVNSTIICITVLCVMELLMNQISNPLLLSGTLEIWYGAWILCYSATVYLLYKTHRVLKVNLAKLVNTVAFAHVVLSFTQAFRYVDRAFLGGEHLDMWYYLAINSLNISVALIVLFTLVREKEEKRVGLYI